ncbi:MAG: hypothetical protein K2J65_04260 [Duncaniella sp.]|nr:hypothetical protein [Duncaniella sp.]
MKKLLLTLVFIPLTALSAISDWDYMPFISYTGQYPTEIIRQGRNFELLQVLWDKPQNLQTLHNSGFDLSDIDTTLLINQGMIYRKDDKYYSAIPFIDSLATDKLRIMAHALAENIIEDTKPEMQKFFSTLDNAGCKEYAFPLVHSLVFDDIIWKHLGVSCDNATVCPTDSMSWNGIFYFFRPEGTDTYGTNGIRLNDKQMLKFSWGNNSNAYLCTTFVQTNILKAIRYILNGEELNDDMIRDCKTYGVIDDNNLLLIPVLNGQDKISNAADVWADSAAQSFSKHFDGENIANTIDWSGNYNEAACKVIIYHEVLSAIDKVLDTKGVLPVPEILKLNTPSDKKQTASVAYITTR